MFNNQIPWMNNKEGMPCMWMHAMPCCWWMMPPAWLWQMMPPAMAMPQWKAGEGCKCVPPQMNPEQMKQLFPFIDPKSPIGEWLNELMKWMHEMPAMQKPGPGPAGEASEEKDENCQKQGQCPPLPPFPFATQQKREEYKPFSWLTPEKASAILKIIFDASFDNKDYED